MEQKTETSIIQPGSATVPTPQSLPAPCPTCAGAPGSQPRSYVYALVQCNVEL